MLVTTTLEFPYSRTLGPIVAAFAEGLREGRLLASRTSDGRLLMPPLEHDPTTSAPVEDQLVEVGPGGVVESWAWVPRPTARQPYDRPFAFALIKVDGADTGLVHVLTAESPGEIVTGMRVRPRWRQERLGRIDDIEGWEPEAGAREPDRRHRGVGTGGMTDAPKDHLVMEDFVSLTYSEELTPHLQRFGELLLAGRIVGHRSPSGNVFVPGRGYDPVTMELTSEADEVDVAETGTLTSHTIIVPVQYYGQEATEPYVIGTVLLDGASNAIHQQRIVNIPHHEVRDGLRVRAVWKAEGERSLDSMSNRWWGGFECAIAGFEPTGEPDVPLAVTREHMF